MSEKRRKEQQMILVIAEKPEVAKSIAGAMLKNIERHDGYITGQNGDRKWAVTSAFGHLLRHAYPGEIDSAYKERRLDTLPLYFRNWPVIPGNKEEDKYKTDRLNVIGKLLREAEYVIHAGDPDDEGQLLIDEITDFWKYSGKVLRVLINDNMPDNIRKEFSRLKDNSEFVSMGRAARARSMADICFGINESRLAEIKLKRPTLSVGRVQTPTLGLVVSRDRAIDDHVAVRHYELTVPCTGNGFENIPFEWKPSEKYLKSIDSRIVTDRGFVEGLADVVDGNEYRVKTVESIKTTNPPLPYNLTVLQEDMNKRYGYSASQTQEITQSLRAKRAITYNRSDSQYLKEEHYEEAPELFNTILDGTLTEKYGLDFAIHSKCFNDGSVTAHHGIIPQCNNINVNSLTAQEKNVYMAIVMRYAQQFMRPEKRKVSVSSFTQGYCGFTENFEYRVETVTDKGFTESEGKKDAKAPKKEKAYIPEGLWIGRISGREIASEDTKPPARYTEGSLIKDMSSVAKYVTDPEIKEILLRKDAEKRGENGSIGTVATRAFIIQSLIKRGFLENKGKEIRSTRLGKEFYDVLPESISGVDITARWWTMQEDIISGKEKDINVIMDSVVENFNRHKDDAYENAEVKGYEEKEKATGIWQGRETTITRTWSSHRFTDEELEVLFSGGKITFTATRGKSTYKVTGMLSEQEYKGHRFTGFKADGGEEREDYIYGDFCGSRCGFKKVWGGHEFTEAESESLLRGETVTIICTSDDGTEKPVKGKLEWQSYKGHAFLGFSMIREEREDYIYGDFYGSRCGFKKIWNGHEFTKEEAEALLSGKTIEIEYGTDGAGETVTGKLEWQHYKGHTFLGFKQEQKERLGYVTGKLRGKEVSFKRTWGGHTFTDDEIAALLEGEYIEFEAVSSSGSCYTARGRLSRQTYNGHKFTGFKPEFK